MQRIVTLVICGAFTTFLYAQQFQEVSLQAGVNHFQESVGWMGGGVVLADFTNDNYLDIFLTGGSAKDGYYVNNGDGTFTEMTDSAGFGLFASVVTMGAVSGDINNDGWLDLLVTTVNNLPNMLFLNNGNGTFTELSNFAGLTHTSLSLAAAFGDYNLDGFLDIYIGNYVQVNQAVFDSLGNITGFDHTCFSNYMYINNGDLTFTEISDDLLVSDSGGCALAITFIDIDQDYDMDIYLANDFGAFEVSNRAFRNNFPVNSFTDVSAATGLDIALFGMGIAKGDYDEDGDFDFYVTNLGRNSFLQNDGHNHFTDIATSLGVENTFVGTDITTGWGTQFCDLDNDSYLDLFVANGKIQIPPGDYTPADLDPNKLYKNDGNGGFIDISDSAGIANTDYCRGSAYGDIDNDGDLDLVVANMFPSSFTNRHALIYENITNNNKNYLKAKLNGVLSNKSGFGAIVKLFTNDRTFIQEIDGGSSHVSQNSAVAHFGLDTISTVDSLMVIWPGGNKQVVYPPIKINHFHSIVEQVPPGICDLPITALSDRVTPTSVLLSWNGAYTNYSPFVLRGKIAGSNNWTYFNLGLKREQSFKNLSINTTYVWQVKRECDSLDLYWSNLDTFTTTCAAPDLLVSSNISQNSALLSWNSPPSLSYKLVGRQLGINTKVEIDIPKHINQYQATGLNGGTSYIWTIQAYCDAQKSMLVYSSTIDTFTTSTAPNKVTDSKTAFLNVYPNPTTGVVIIENLLGKEKMHEIRLVDLQGKQLMQVNPVIISRHKMTISNEISNGVYTLIVVMESGETNHVRLILNR